MEAIEGERKVLDWQKNFEISVNSIKAKKMFLELFLSLRLQIWYIDFSLPYKSILKKEAVIFESNENTFTSL